MDVKNLFLTISFSILSIALYAQYTVSGTIRDISSDETLIGVSVYLPSLKIGTATDLDGNFSISDLKRGSYILEASYTGYKTLSLKLDLKQDTVLNIKLAPSATELSEVIVTGVTRTSELKRNPVIISTINNASLRESSSTNLIDALTGIPGVEQMSTGPNISKPVIRGLGYNRLITLNNGMKQEGQQWGDEHGIEIDEYSIDRVEIIKGPGSLLYGSDGIAGVLNFLPPKPPHEGKTITQFISNYQSNNNLIGYSLSNAGNSKGFHWLGRFSNKYAGNYSNKYDGKVYNTGFQEYNGNLSLGLTKSNGHFNLSVNSYNTKLGIAEGERNELGNFIYEDTQGKEHVVPEDVLRSYQLGIPYQIVNHFSIASNNLFRLNKGTINIDIGYQNNRRKEFEEAEDPDEYGLYLALNTLNYNARYNIEKIKGWETSVGIGGIAQFNKNMGEEFLIPDYQLFDIGAFVFTQKSFNGFTLAGGLRFENQNIRTFDLFLDEDGEPTENPDDDSELKFAHFSKHHNGLSGSIGMSYQLSNTSTLKFNFSNGFRAPNIAELASNGKHEGTFRYEIGNQNLKSEFSHQLDLAYSRNSEHVSLDISPFINFVDNYIFIEKLKDAEGNDIYPDPEDLSPAFEYRAGNATLWGGEIYLDVHPHPLDWLHIENAFSFVRGVQNNQSDSTRYLPFIPAPHYRGGLKAQFKDLTAYVSDFYVKFNVDHYFAQNKIYSAYETESPTTAYTLLSAGIGASFNVFNKKDFISLYLNGENLADVAYQHHLSRLKYAPINPVTGRKGIFNMGRNFSIKMVLNI